MASCARVSPRGLQALAAGARRSQDPIELAPAALPLAEPLNPAPYIPLEGDLGDNTGGVLKDMAGQLALRDSDGTLLDGAFSELKLNPDNTWCEGVRGVAAGLGVGWVPCRLPYQAACRAVASLLQVVDGHRHSPKRCNGGQAG